MAFRVANTGETIPAKFDGALRSTYANNQDYIVKDVGDQFALTYTSGSLVVHCGTGVANISGRGISSDEDNTITLPNNSTIYLCLRVDLTQIQGQEGMLYANTSSAIASDNLSNTNGIHDLLLAVITTNGTTITSLQDRRVIKERTSIDYVAGTNIQINNNVISATIPTATASAIGGIKVGTGLAISNSVLSAKFPAINTSNAIYSSTSATSYTATQDCFVVGHCVNAYQTIKVQVNNVDIANFGTFAGDYGSAYDTFYLPIKAGDTVKISYSAGATSHSIKAFGIKY